MVVLPFALLFLTGDAAFAGLAVRPAAAASSLALPGRVARSALVLAAADRAGARRAAAARPRGAPARDAGSRLAEWLIPLAVLDALFLAFVLVQITVLFGGHDRVLQTSGLTYAEYARSGFWQLLAAAGADLRRHPASPGAREARGRRERLLLHGLLARSAR